MLQVQVRDSGSGIAAEDVSKLFSRFGKLERTQNINQEGVGLGLTIVKNIVEQSQGKVELYSAGIDKGSTFRISMHMKSAHEHQPSFEEIMSPIQLIDRNESLSSDSCNSQINRAINLQIPNSESRMLVLPRRRVLKKDLGELMDSERHIDGFESERQVRNIEIERAQLIFNSKITSE